MNRRISKEDFPMNVLTSCQSCGTEQRIYLSEEQDQAEIECEYCGEVHTVSKAKLLIV